MANCYKCHTTENLSLKRQNPKTGYKLMICRPCRNTAAKHYEKPEPVDRLNDQDEWNILSALSIQRVLERRT